MKVSDLFDVRIGFTLHLNALSQAKGDSSINYVSRTGENNGVAARVEKVQNVTPYPAGLLSCAVGGTVLSTFVQDEAFYVSRDMYILTPLRKMSLREKLYWCLCIKANAYRYCYGRLANKTLANLKLPDEVPAWVQTTKCKPITTKIRPRKLPLHEKSWKEFTMGDLFNFTKGKRLTRENMSVGYTNYIGAISDNNGVRQKIDAEKMFDGNCLTVNYNGSVGEAFYQGQPFWASDDVNVLHLREATLSKYIGLFLATVIRQNIFRFSYGRKWTLDKMRATILLLPSTPSGLPDWPFMEQYIKSLPYSDRI